MKLTANPAWLALSPHCDKASGAKFLRIMKLTTIIILAACLHTSAKGVAQQTITFSGKEVSLEIVFSAIKKQTNYRFFFNTDMLTNASKVTLEVKNAQVEQVMNMALKDQPLTFTIKGRTIFVMKKVEEEKKSTQVATGGDPITVSGKILDENGVPAQGVNVTIKGTNKVTTTNIKGEWVLKGVEENSILQISSVGYDRQEIFIKNRYITTQLKIAVGNLDEMQVIAYGTTSKRFNTGNVATIKSSDIEKQPINNALLALQGRVPGLVITQESGITGGPVTIRVQGKNSIANGNDPLIVIDGVPYPTTMLRTGLENVLGTNLQPSSPSPLSFINPSDIESMDVLKDADATAIYGSRAANGAILITTKKGKSGRPKASFNVQHGVGKVARKVKMLNSREYLDMRYEAYLNDGIDWRQATVSANDLKLWDTSRNTDWQNELIGGTAKFSNVNASVSGGTSAIQYALGGTYQRQTTVFPGDFNDQRGAMHISLNTNSANQKFRIQFLGNYMADVNRLPGIDLTEKAILLEPVAPRLYNDEGKLNWEANSSGNSTWDNPLMDVLYRKYENKTNNLVGNLQLMCALLNGLDIRISTGFTKTLSDEFISTPISAIKPESRNVSPSPRRASYGYRDVNTWIVEPQLYFQRAIANGKLEALIGVSVQHNQNEVRNINGSGYTSDENLKNSGAATSLTSATFYTLYKYNAIFGRLNYNWRNKYILNITMRRDGSSRFGDKSKFQNFGSVGGGWLFSEEHFIQNMIPFLSFGKLRASYGVTGNDQIGDYAYLNLYGNISGQVPYQNSTGLMPNSLSNPYLEWEETHKLQLGSDLGFFNDRLVISVTYARNRSSNQLLSYTLPSLTGFTSVSDNFPATIQNTSWEFAINTVNVKRKGISWTSSFNLTLPKNELISFPNLETSSYASTLIVGKPLGIIQAFHYVGLDPGTGKYLVSDKDGNPTTTPNFNTDRTVLINTQTTLYGGLQNNFQYKGLELDFLFQFVKQIGSDFYFNNGTSLSPGVFVSGSSNQPKTTLSHWQKIGDEKPIQKYTSGRSTLLTELNNVKGSEVSYKDASFIRLKNISLTYALPSKWMQKVNITNCRIVVRGQNLLTITNYRGLDPENQSISVLPPLRITTVGIMLGL